MNAETDEHEAAFDRGWAKGRAWGEQQERERIASAIRVRRDTITLKEIERLLDPERAAVLAAIDEEGDTHD